MIGFNVIRYQSFGNWLYHSWLYTQKYNYFFMCAMVTTKKGKKTLNYRFFAFSFVVTIAHIKNSCTFEYTTKSGTTNCQNSDNALH